MFEIPADISALDDEALTQALEAAQSEAAEFDNIDDVDLTDDHIERLSALADFATKARADQAKRNAESARDLARQQDAAAKRAGRIATARSALRTQPADPAPAAVEPAEQTVEQDVEQQPEPAVAAAAAVNITTLPPAPAATSVVSRAAGVRAQTQAALVPAPKPSITASADVPGFVTGGELNDLDEVGKAVIARMKALPTSRIGGRTGVQNRYSVANLNLAQVRSAELMQGAAQGDDQGLLTRARNEARLAGGSLTAAGGWCAPSETLYDLCQIATTDGLLDLPTINVTRGGIRFTRGPGFDTIYNDPNLGWWLTEAEVIAGPTGDEPLKPCITVTCPEFEEVRLDAVGLCIRVPLLTQAAYPELIRWTIENTLIAHQHKVDTTLIGKIVDQSTDLDVAGTFETTIDSIAKIEQAANWIRQSWRMRFNETLEVLAPIWYRTTVRADLARRTGVDLINVTDATIESYFTARGIRVQWLYNYQPLTNDSGVVQTPDEVQIVMYPAGTWVKGTTDVITLDAVYDSQSLQENVFTALFTEEGVLVVNQCFDSYTLTLPTCASGRTGAADLVSCALGTP